MDSGKAENSGDIVSSLVEKSSVHGFDFNGNWFDIGCVDSWELANGLHSKTKKQNILVTGGAGYIGSAAVKALIGQGHTVVCVDNWSKGKKDLVDPKAIFDEGDLTDNKKLERVFSKHDFDSIMHFASYKAAGESMHDLEKYSNNIN